MQSFSRASTPCLSGTGAKPDETAKSRPVGYSSLEQYVVPMETYQTGTSTLPSTAEQNLIKKMLNQCIAKLVEASQQAGITIASLLR